MKARQGFSLIEVVVVVSLIILLMGFGVPAYSTWKKRNDMESQITKLAAELHQARMRSYVEKTVYGIWWGDTRPFSSFQLRRDANGDGDVDDLGTDVVIQSFTCKFPVNSTNTTIKSIGFDTRGFTSDLTTLYVSGGGETTRDCLTVSRTRIISGKWNAAANQCIPK